MCWMDLFAMQGGEGGGQLLCDRAWAVCGIKEGARAVCVRRKGKFWGAGPNVQLPPSCHRQGGCHSSWKGLQAASIQSLPHQS
jgi:hypothetical protein